MKTLETQNKIKKSITLLVLLFTLTSISNNLNAQTRTVTIKGIINSDIGPLDSVSIYLKNSKTGTISKGDGTFTFPTQLKVGDVLIFSYLGYEKQSFVIKQTSSFLDIFMKEAPVDILSATNSNKPYKSKRSKSK